MHHIQQLRKKSNLNFFTKVPFCNIFQNWLGKFQTINKAREKSWGQKVCRGTAMYKAYCNTFIQCVHLDRDKNLINDSLRSACQWLQLINLEITISSKYIPQLSRAKLILPSSPSNIVNWGKASIKSLLGPPRSTASSGTPISSENLTEIVWHGSYVPRLKPLMAPSRTVVRFILNLDFFWWFIFLASVSKISHAGTKHPVVHLKQTRNIINTERLWQDD